MKIKSISYAGKEDVFNLEVEDTHNFAVENGAIVHNCRYVLMANPIAARKNMAVRIPDDDPLRFFTEQPSNDKYAFYRI